MKPQNKEKKETKKPSRKFYFLVGFFVLFLIIIAILSFVNRGDDYADDYISEYKIEEPDEDVPQNGDTLEFFAEDLSNTVIKIMLWTMPIMVVIIFLATFTRVFRRLDLL